MKQLTITLIVEIPDGYHLKAEHRIARECGTAIENNTLLKVVAADYGELGNATEEN